MALIEDVFKALVVFIGIKQVAGSCDNVTLFSIQMDMLLAGYDRGNPPATPVTVSAWLDVRHSTILEPTATVRLLADFHLKWMDSRFAWNATEWGCDNSLVSSGRLWLPDVGLLSAAVSGSDPTDTGLRARVTSGGQVTWATRLDLTAPITMDLYSWPADEHEVTFKFGSRSHSLQEMEIVLNETKNALMFGSSSWEATSVSGSSQLWDNVGVQRRVVSWSVRLRRQGPAHRLAVGAVMMTTAFLLAAAAMLPPDSRPALCAAAATTSAIWLISSAPKLSASARVPLILSLVCAQCVLACVCAACAALVRRVARCTAPPPQALRALLTATSLHCHLTPTESGEGQSNAWAAAAQLLDRSLLLLLLLTLVILHCIYVFSH